MFYLKCINDNNTFYCVGKDTFRLGRKDCDFLIQNDASVSREHAIIRIKNDRLTLEDCESRYKTKYNDSELKPREATAIDVGSTIQFGIFKSAYRIEQLKVVTTGTHLSSAKKEKLKNELKVFGGKYVENWTSECTHLTAEEMFVSVKLLHALIDEKPVVLSSYWTALSKCVSNNLPLPSIDNYNKPPIKEPLLKKLNISTYIDRKNLFKDKIFVFPTQKSQNQLENVINKAGGECKSCDIDNISLSDIDSSKEVLLLQIPKQEDEPEFKNLVKELTKKGKRTIPLHEISLAVIVGSCEKNCNPNFDRVGIVFNPALAATSTQADCLAHNTESESFREHVGIVKTIPETLEPSLEKSRQIKTDQTCEKAKTNPFLETRNSTNDANALAKRKMTEVKVEENTTAKKFKLMEKENWSTNEKPSISSGPSSSNTNPIQNKRKLEGESSEGFWKRVNPFAKFSQKDIKKEESQSGFKLEKDESSNESNNISKVNPFNTTGQTSPTGQTSLSAGSGPRTSDISPSKNNTRSDISTPSKNNTRSDISTESKPDLTMNSYKYRSGIDYSNCSWISKPEVPKEKPVPADPDEAHYRSLFKGKVVIEFLDASYFRRALSISKDVTDGSNACGKKNFKKFKKKLPLNPQTVLFEPTQLISANNKFNKSMD